MEETKHKIYTYTKMVDGKEKVSNNRINIKSPSTIPIIKAGRKLGYKKHDLTKEQIEDIKNLYKLTRSCNRVSEIYNERNINITPYIVRKTMIAS